jgi:predicted component of type VI protein secretion system
MAAAIRLTVMTGPHQKRTFCFCGPTRCQAGRALDCFINFGGTQRDQLISRYHCQLEIDPPGLLIQDLGSRNGTFINGKRVEALPADINHSEVLGALCNHGDLITLGGTTMRVDVVDCPHAGNAEHPGWDGEMSKNDCQLACPK